MPRSRALYTEIRNETTTALAEHIHFTGEKVFWFSLCVTLKRPTAPIINSSKNSVVHENISFWIIKTHDTRSKADVKKGMAK